jgi:hypothetical protein
MFGAIPMPGLDGSRGIRKDPQIIATYATALKMRRMPGQVVLLKAELACHALREVAPLQQRAGQRDAPSSG